ITEKNGSRRRNPSLHFRPIVMDEHLVAYLGRSGMTLDSVPAAGKKVYVGGAADLTIGGESVECTDSVPEVVKQTAVAAVRAIPGLRWAGVDLVVVEDGPGRGRACVLEINSNAGISGFHYPVYGVPRNVARRLWETRLTYSSSPAVRRAHGKVAPPVHTAPRPFVSEM